MREKFDVRIVHRRGHYDKMWKIFLYWPKKNQTVNTGLKAGPTREDLDAMILKVKKILESKGNYRISVVAG